MPPFAPALIRSGTPLLDRATSAARRVWFCLCTPDVDRHGTIFDPMGVDLTAHKQNPVFLWMHDSGGAGLPTPPPDIVIGRVVTYDQTPERLDIEVEFDDDGEDGLASTCFRKVKDGFLRMVSIGCSGAFDETTLVDGVEVPTCRHSELVECSLVIIGSNRAATKLNRAAVAKMLREGVNLASNPVDLTDVGKTKYRGVGTAPLDICEAGSPSFKPRKATMPTQVISVAVFNQDGHMLWGRRRDTNKFTTPGGHFEEGEHLLQAVKRELREETGFTAFNRDLEYLSPVEIQRPDGVPPLYVHCFRYVVPAPGQPTDTSSDPDNEVSTWQWVPLGDDNALPDDVALNLHAPRNAFHTLGIISHRSLVAGAQTTQPLLSDVVDDGDLTSSLLGHNSDGGLVVKTRGAAAATIQRGVVAYKHFPMADGAWDADAAVGRWRRWSSKDGTGAKDTIDWRKYAECFLWFDSSDPHSFGSYVFPHHDIVRGIPVTMWRGIVAAAARIDQATDIPRSDIVAMKSHIADHYHDAHKTAPWERRDVSSTMSLLRRAFAGLDVREATKLLPPALRAAFSGAETVAVPPLIVPSTAVKDGPAHTPVAPGSEDPNKPLMCKLTPHALVFDPAKYPIADAVIWAKEHGYNPSPAKVLDGDYAVQGFVAVAQSVVIEQLPRDVFQPSVFGTGVRFMTTQYANGVGCVYGVLKTTKRYVAAAAAALFPGVDLTASPTTRAEMVLAMQRRSHDSSCDCDEDLDEDEREECDCDDLDVARAVVASGQWGVVTAARRSGSAATPLRGAAAGQRDVARIALQLRQGVVASALRDAAQGDGATAHAVVANLSLYRSQQHYIITPTTLQQTSRNVPPQPAATQTERSTMKRTPEARAAYRGMIHHSLEHADMQMRLMDEGHVADESCAAHRAMAMRALDHAEEMQEMCRSAFAGDVASQDIKVDGGMATGEVFNIPRVAGDEELSNRAAAVATKCGKLPRSLRAVVKARLNTADVDLLDEELLGAKSDRTALLDLRRSAADGAEKLARVETEKLIEHGLDKRFVTPADAREMRGLDPVTGAVTSSPWPKHRVERFIARRAEVGPVGDIARPGAVRTVQQDETGKNVAAPAKQSLVRSGFSSGRPATEQDIASTAANLTEGLKRYGLNLNVADVLGKTDEAAALPSSNV